MGDEKIVMLMIMMLLDKIRGAKMDFTFYIYYFVFFLLTYVPTYFRFLYSLLAFNVHHLLFSLLLVGHHSVKAKMSFLLQKTKRKTTDVS